MYVLRAYTKPYVIEVCTQLLATLPVLDVGVIGHASGSAYVEQGSTKVICAVYGPREIPRYIFATYAFNTGFFHRFTLNSRFFLNIFR